MSRTVLLANTPFFVNPAGSNDNDGLSVGQPFAAMQKADDVLVASIDMAGHDVQINVAAGTYDAPLQARGDVPGQRTYKSIKYVGVGEPLISVSASGQNAIAVGERARRWIGGFRFKVGAGGDPVAAFNGGVLGFGFNRLIPWAPDQLPHHYFDVRHGAEIIHDDIFTITGGGDCLWYAEDRSVIRGEFNGVYVQTDPDASWGSWGSASFSGAVASASSNSIIYPVMETWAGTITGRRRAESSGGVIPLADDKIPGSYN